LNRLVNMLKYLKQLIQQGIINMETCHPKVKGGVRTRSQRRENKEGISSENDTIPEKIEEKVKNNGKSAPKNNFDAKDLQKGLIQVLRNILNTPNLKFNTDKKKVRKPLKEFIFNTKLNQHLFKEISIKSILKDNRITGTGVLKSLIFKTFSRTLDLPADQEFKELLQLVNDVVFYIFGSDKKQFDSRINFFSKLRQILKPQPVKYKLSREILQIGKDEFLQMEKLRKMKVVESNRMPEQFNYRDILEFISTHKNSEDWKYQFICLSLGVGSRPVELAFLSSFSELSDEDVKIKPEFNKLKNKMVKVSGLAKKRGKNPDENYAFRPLIGYTSKEFVLRHLELREELNKFTKGKIITGNTLNQNIQKNVNRIVKKEFPKFGFKNPTLYITRKIYGATAFQRFKNSLNIRNRNQFISDILGHSGINSSFHYSTVEAKEKDNTILEAQVDEIEDKIDNLTENLTENKQKEPALPRSTADKILSDETENRIKNLVVNISKLKSEGKHQQNLPRRSLNRRFSKEQKIAIIEEVIKKFEENEIRYSPTSIHNNLIKNDIRGVGRPFILKYLREKQM